MGGDRGVPAHPHHGLQSAGRAAHPRGCEMSVDIQRTGPAASIGVWERYAIQDGLPDMKIECVFQDSRGYLWIGTHEKGVVRYDWDQFRTFTRRDGLAGDGVYSILEDPQGDLWFGTDGGLTRYNGAEHQVIRGEESCGYLWGSCVDAEGALWFGVERRPGHPPAVSRWDGTSLTTVFLTDTPLEQGESIHVLVRDGDGGLLCGGHGVYRLRRNEARGLVEPSATGEQVSALLSRGRVLYVAGESGIHAWNTDSIGAAPRLVHAGGVMAMCEDQSGGAWATTDDGRLLFLHNGIFGVAATDNAAFWRALCVDSLDRLWIGTYGYGLLCYDEGRVRVFEGDDHLPPGPVLALSKCPDEGIWIGTAKGVVCGRRDTFIPVRMSPEGDADEETVTALLTDRAGQCWVGTRGGSVYCVADTGTRLCPAVEEMVGHTVGALVEDPDGRIWFSSRIGAGFGYYSGEQVCYYSPTGTSEYPTRIGAMHADPSGGVLLGSASPSSWDGLCRHDGRSSRPVPGISGTPILALCEARSGRLWVGTTEGISCHEEDYVLTYTQEDGLSCEIITAIHEDGDGVLWFGTEGGGLGCHDGKAFQVWQIGEQPAHNVVRAICQGDGGEIWIGTQGGLIKHTPRRRPPDVRISQVVADDTYEAPAEVQFPDTAGRLTIRFRGSSQSDRPEHLVYRYRLEGSDVDWRQTRLGQADYPQLSPGTYRFAVLAVDRDLNYSEEASTQIVVTEDPRLNALTEALRSGAASGDFIGESSAIDEVKRQIREVAWTDLTVLVLGETGTGKGLAARAIHEASERRRAPFIQVNCGALPTGLVDSELFGHERGAFTGAASRRLGKFELADNGTIFLDEIGDLPLESQTRLLRVLQERCIERVGGKGTIDVDVRVIAATNRDLVKEIRTERYRADLYYRLNVFPIRIPPLRERQEDVTVLVEYFIQRFAAHLDQTPPTLNEEALEVLRTYEWPGNVRELEHTLQRAALLSGDGIIRPDHLGLGPVATVTSPGTPSPIVPLAEYERQYLERVLEYTGGVIHGKRGAAVLLGMKPTTLRSRLEKHGIRRRKRQSS